MAKKAPARRERTVAGSVAIGVIGGLLFLGALLGAGYGMFTTGMLAEPLKPDGVAIIAALACGWCYHEGINLLPILGASLGAGVVYAMLMPTLMIL